MDSLADQICNQDRLSALHATALLATPPEESFDRITRLTAQLLSVPVALVSLVDADHQFFKSCVGLPEPWATARRTPLTHSFCQHVVATERMLAVEDARVDPILKTNLAIRDIGVVAYLGAPIVSADGHTLGSLCAIDTKPVRWTGQQKKNLADLAVFAGTEIESRRVAAAQTLLQAARIEARLENRVHFIADAVPQIVWTGNSDGNVTYYNKRWFDYTGLNFEQTKDWGWKKVVHPDDLDACVTEWSTAVREGRASLGEWRLKRASDGEYRWHLCRSIPSRDSDGTIIEWVGTSTDIHDSKVAHAAMERSHDELERRVIERTDQLRREHQFVETVMANVTCGIVACGADKQITYLNAAVRRMIALEESDAGTGDSTWAADHLPLYDPETEKLLTWDQRPLGRALAGEIVDDTEVLIKPRDRSIRNVFISARAITDGTGKITGAVAAWRDLTDLRRLQRQLVSARKEADDANKAKSDFLANMSHEIRTPITAIVGFADLLDHPDLTAAIRAEYVQIVRRNSAHLLGLINDVLDLSKIEAGQMTVERAECDLPALLAEVMSTLRPQASDRGLEFDLRFDGPIPRTVQTDPLRLRQILINLLGNALKFTEVGSVRTTVSFTDGAANRIQFEIEDTGIGMDRVQRDRIFGAFRQADESTTRRFGGTGLGLMISRRLARLLGGDITVRSTPGVGSVFVLTTDCGPGDSAPMVTGLEEAGIAALPAKPGTAGPVPLNGHILLVEDGRDNQRLISTLLRNAGAEVTIAENGLLALQRLAVERFDLILMDMQMPEMDGYATTAELRRRGVEVPVIALTANAMAEDRAKCLARGCTDYLSKPINAGSLVGTVGKYLDSGNRRPGAAGSNRPVSTATGRGGVIRSALRDYPGLAKVIDQYIDGLPDQVAALQALVESADTGAVRRMIHQIKGSGGGYGFDAITEAADEVERIVKSASDDRAIANGVGQLIDVIRRVENFNGSRHHRLKI